MRQTKKILIIGLSSLVVLSLATWVLQKGVLASVAPYLFTSTSDEKKKEAPAGGGGGDTGPVTTDNWWFEWDKKYCEEHPENELCKFNENMKEQECNWNPLYRMAHLEECTQIVFCQSPEKCSIASGLEKTRPGVGELAGAQEEWESKTSPLAAFLYWLVNAVLGLLFFAAMTAMIVAGFMWLVDLGKEERAKKAGKIVAWAALGMLLVLVAYPLLNAILRAFSE
ncbi:hypothetical protein AUJ78_01075 [Candidatus Peregrinibacteria bacterium CG1_02_41_10]|nr:MAG: hypothetical protein AUJ78_01075 [Candidatus Peregrinibacteria bacterium CG1_02_41_10]